MNNLIQDWSLQLKRATTYMALTLMLVMFTWCMPQSVLAEDKGEPLLTPIVPLLTPIVSVFSL